MRLSHPNYLWLIPKWESNSSKPLFLHAHPHTLPTFRVELQRALTKVRRSLASKNLAHAWKSDPVLKQNCIKLIKTVLLPRRWGSSFKRKTKSIATVPIDGTLSVSGHIHRHIDVTLARRSLKMQGAILADEVVPGNSEQELAFRIGSQTILKQSQSHCNPEDRLSLRPFPYRKRF